MTHRLFTLPERTNMDNLYTKNELSNKLKLSVSTLDNHMKDGRLEYIKFGKSVRFTEANALEYVKKHNTKQYTASIIDSVGVEGFKNVLTG